MFLHHPNAVGLHGSDRKHTRCPRYSVSPRQAGSLVKRLKANKDKPKEPKSKGGDLPEGGGARKPLNKSVPSPLGQHSLMPYTEQKFRRLCLKRCLAFMWSQTYPIKTFLLLLYLWKGCVGSSLGECRAGLTLGGMSERGPHSFLSLTAHTENTKYWRKMNAHPHMHPGSPEHPGALQQGGRQGQTAFEQSRFEQAGSIPD